VDLDDWKDLAEVMKNFAQTGFLIVAIVALLRWASKDKASNRDISK
jgi:sugar phosphate isomerase/epimerase